MGKQDITSARRAQQAFVGTLVSLSSVRRSELGSGGEAEKGSYCVIRSSLRDYLIYRHSPILSAHALFLPFFSCLSLSSRLFRREERLGQEKNVSGQNRGMPINQATPQ